MIYSTVLLKHFIGVFAFVFCFFDTAQASSSGSVLVVGSINADVIIPMQKFPLEGETVMAHDTEDAGRTYAGGKGANQAVSCSKLGIPTSFMCQLGSDANAIMLQEVLEENNVDISLAHQSDKPSGLGLVFLQPSGKCSHIVVGGANSAWPQTIGVKNIFEHRRERISCVMLQMEIPQHINELVAQAAHAENIPVFQDIGGADREISDSHLKNCDFIAPNLTELQRMTKRPVSSEEEIIDAARNLQKRGANNVLVTLGEVGSLLITKDGAVLKEPCASVELILDETGAGDNYRAAFVVSHLVEQNSLQESMAFASAAGALAVEKLGAIPSCSTRAECMAKLMQAEGTKMLNHPEGEERREPPSGSSPFPFQFASRLNSMKDRQDDGMFDGPRDVYGWIARQGHIQGLDLIDFNYPQHLTSPVTEDECAKISSALAEAGLRCGAVCLRFPKEMRAGAFTNPDPVLRAQAVQLTKEACAWAAALGADEVVVWSAFDGYDYSMQVDYDDLWDQVVSAFQEVCDAHTSIKVSLEYKPTDENTRFFTVPSTGASMLLCNHVNRENFGLTLDFGHCLMAGENPAQSVAMVSGRSNACTRRGKNKLFGVQLGDGYGRLGAEDGLAFGSIHPAAAFEFVYWLIKTNFRGHIYFDTFPRNEDPIRECEYNIRQFKMMANQAHSMLHNEAAKGTLEQLMRSHDAMGVLDFMHLWTEDPDVWYD